MEGPSPEFALSRIDAALARIEAVAARPRPDAGPDAGNADSDLAVRHERLRKAVAESLRQVDGMIAEQES